MDADNLLLLAMVAMAQSDRDFDPSERQAISDIYEQLSGIALSDGALNEAFQDQVSSTDELCDTVKSHAKSLTKEQKEQILSGAYLVLLADGKIAAEEKYCIHQVADALGMPEIHYQAVLEGLDPECAEKLGG